MSPRPRLFTGATVLSPDPLPPGHDSVAVVDGTIVAVGPRDDAATALPGDHELIDLRGRVVVPGFVDAHLHPLPACFFEHHEDVADATDLEELFDRLSDRAAREPDDAWVVGLRVDDDALAERRLPDRVELDRVGGGRPVVLLRRDGHHAVGSSAALAAAGFHAGAPDPPGGVVHRDADGRPDGLCGERAASLLLAGVPSLDLADFEVALDAVVARLARQGVTSISAICQTTDEGPSGEAGALEAVGWSALVERVPFDVQTILVGASAEEVDEHRAGALHDPARDRRLDAVKLFLDGTLGGHTACMHAPYADGGGSGMLTLDIDEAYRRMREAHLAGLQICVHAIGDRANHLALDLFARLQAEHPADPQVCRHRIEHASVLDPRAVERFGELGVSAVVQPISLASEHHWLARRLGDRLERVYPFRDLLDAGVRVAGSSDAPIESVEVLEAMRCATDRLGIAPDQAVTPAEALDMYTRGGGWVRRAEHRVGTIAVGRRADLAVLDADPRYDLGAADVVATYCAGERLELTPPAEG